MCAGDEHGAEHELKPYLRPEVAARIDARWAHAKNPGRPGNQGILESGEQQDAGEVEGIDAESLGQESAGDYDAGQEIGKRTDSLIEDR